MAGRIPISLQTAPACPEASFYGTGAGTAVTGHAIQRLENVFHRIGGNSGNMSDPVCIIKINEMSKNQKIAIAVGVALFILIVLYFVSTTKQKPASPTNIPAAGENNQAGERTVNGYTREEYALMGGYSKNDLDLLFS
jgi:hypothetical protein